MSSTIIRKSVRASFTTVPNEAVRDPRLSWGATGLLVYLLGLPDGWEVKSADLMQRKTDGRDATRTHMRKLRECGYLTVTKTRVVGGRFRTVITVFDEPVTGDGFPGAGQTGAGQTGAGEPGLLGKNQVRKNQVGKNHQETTTGGRIKPNTFDGECIRCKGFVAAGEGRLVGKRVSHLDGRCIGNPTKVVDESHLSVESYAL